MAHLITLAHRVSSLHARYSSIHGALFTFSFARFKSQLGSRAEPLSCEYQRELAKLNEQLSEIRAIINEGAELEPNTTFSREFATALEGYIQALSDSISKLSEICYHQCLSDQGRIPYVGTQVRTDRIAYDESIQYYRWLGEQLNLMVRKL